MKLIVDLIYEGGIANMRYSISDTAEYGDMTRGPRIVTDETRAEMKQILDEIQTGKFAQEWILENQAGRPVFNALRTQSAEHPIEEVGDRLRSMMPWIGAGQGQARATSPAASRHAPCRTTHGVVSRRVGRAADHRRGR